MKSTRLIVFTVLLGAGTFSACGGRLNVGDKNKLGTGGTGAENGEGGSGGGEQAGGRSALGGMSSSAGKSSGGSSGFGGAAGQAGSAGTAGSVSASGGTAGSGTAGSPAIAGAFSTGGRAMGGMGGLDFNFGTGGTAPLGGKSWVDDIPPAPPVEGSSPDCEDGPFESGRSCAVKGQVCGYRFSYGDPGQEPQEQYEECSCIGKEGSTTWYCEFAGAGVPVCEEGRPEDGEDCFGSFGGACDFPFGYCTCSAESGVWECEEPQEPPPHLAPPEDVDAEHAVAELDGEEQTAWCTWFATAMSGGPGFILPSDAPVADGYVYNFGCMFGAFTSPCNAMVPTLSVAQCAANLAVSACEAPVSKLTGCIRDIFGGFCQREQTSCAEYFATPGCDGTLLVELTGAPSGCIPLKVE